MNHVLSLIRAARHAADCQRLLGTDSMIAELIALHEEMLLQLRADQFGDVANPAFLAEMILQHEDALAELRALLDDSSTGQANHAQPWSEVARALSAS